MALKYFYSFIKLLKYLLYNIIIKFSFVQHGKHQTNQKSSQKLPLIPFNSLICFLTIMNGNTAHHAKGNKG